MDKLTESYIKSAISDGKEWIRIQKLKESMDEFKSNILDHLYENFSELLIERTFDDIRGRSYFGSFSADIDFENDLVYIQTNKVIQSYDYCSRPIKHSLIKFEIPFSKLTEIFDGGVQEIMKYKVWENKDD
jgi:hypothetical protein